MVRWRVAFHRHSAQTLLLSLLLTGWLALFSGQAQAARSTAIMIDYETGAVLFAEEPDAAVFPASLTKTMTLYLTFEALRQGRLHMNDELDVSAHAASMSPSKLGLRAGSTIRVKDAILGVVTKSANDAAVVLGEALGGTEAGFARKMTDKARALGMTRTFYHNASGLPDSQQHTTARDTVRMGVHLIHDFPEYYGLFSTRQFTYRGRVHPNHNNLMKRYPGMDGLKTGYIRASGFNLLASATRDGRRLVAAVFGGTSARSRDDSMARLLDKGFAQVALVAAGKLNDDPTTPDDANVLLASATPDNADRAEGDGDTVADIAVAPKAVKPAPKPKTAATAKGKAPQKVASATGRGSYGVQVGAFGNWSQAKRAAAGAVRKAPSLLSSTSTQVSPLKSRKGTVYRARLFGLQVNDASAACKQLKRKGQDCMVYKAG
jgi:D-alanyl-D-alanine carboxypeptidase